MSAQAMSAAVDTEALWRELHDELLAFVGRRVDRDSDAEDIVQDVFLRVHGNLSRLREAESVHGWIYRITRNAIADHYRARSVARKAVEQPAERLSPMAEDQGDDEPAESDPTAELAQCMRPLLERLQAPYAEAIRLTELEGLTQREAARRAGISPSGMKSRVQRGRRQIKDLFLACCSVELDSRRRVIDYGVRDEGEACGECGCGPPDA